MIDDTRARPEPDAIVIIDEDKHREIGPAEQVKIAATADLIDVAGRTILRSAMRAPVSALVLPC